jgi:hypothetical protein
MAEIYCRQAGFANPNSHFAQVIAELFFATRGEAEPASFYDLARGSTGARIFTT